MSTARFDGTAKQTNIYVDTHTVRESESVAYRRQLCIDARDVHTRECCSEAALCGLARKLWGLLGSIDKTDYLKELAAYDHL